MLTLNYSKNKVVLTKFISGCFYKSKNEEAKRGGKFAILPTLCCQLSITVVSTPPSSMSQPS